MSDTYSSSSPEPPRPLEPSLNDEINDMKEGLLKLIEVISSISNNIKVMSENQSLLNDKMNQLLNSKEDVTES